MYISCVINHKQNKIMIKLEDIRKAVSIKGWEISEKEGHVFTDGKKEMFVGFSSGSGVWYWFSNILDRGEELTYATFEQRYSQNNGKTSKGLKTGWAAEKRISKIVQKEAVEKNEAFTKQAIKDMETRLDVLVEMRDRDDNSNSIVSHQWVVEVESELGFTVTKNEKGDIDLTIADSPSLWTSEGVDQIFKHCEFKNKEGEIMPLKKVHEREYRDARIAELEETIQTLNENLEIIKNG